MARAKVLSRDEIKRVMRMADCTRYGLRDRVALALSIQAGMRIGEIAALKIGDVRGIEASDEGQSLSTCLSQRRASNAAEHVSRSDRTARRLQSVHTQHSHRWSLQQRVAQLQAQSDLRERRNKNFKPQRSTHVCDCSPRAQRGHQDDSASHGASVDSDDCDLRDHH